MPKPLHLVRLNPDKFVVAGQRHNIYWPRRMDLLLEAINAEVCGITYLCYDGALTITVPLALVLALALVLLWSAGPAHL